MDQSVRPQHGAWAVTRSSEMHWGHQPNCTDLQARVYWHWLRGSNTTTKNNTGAAKMSVLVNPYSPTGAGQVVNSLAVAFIAWWWLHRWHREQTWAVRECQDNAKQPQHDLNHQEFCLISTLLHYVLAMCTKNTVWTERAISGLSNRKYLHQLVMAPMTPTITQDYNFGVAFWHKKENGSRFRSTGLLPSFNCLIY